MKIGIDIGGMSVKLGLVDENNTISDYHTIITNTDIPAEEFIDEVGEAVYHLLEKTKLTLKDIDGIGIGIPGMIDVKNGIIVYSNNLAWSNVKVVSQLKKTLDTNIEISNDADTAALGEVCAGAAKGYENAVLLTLGTGVGSGVIMNKKVFQGPLNGGCELGHIVVDYKGRPCTCGNIGCLEAYASATALMRMGREAAKSNPDTSMLKACNGKIDDINGKIIFDEAENGDSSAMEVVDEYVGYISMGVANVINAFRPEIIILGGGVAAQKEKLTDKVEAKVANLVFGKRDSQIARIVTSQLGNDAGIIGAANLV